MSKIIRILLNVLEIFLKLLLVVITSIFLPIRVFISFIEICWENAAEWMYYMGERFENFIDE